MIEIKYKKDCCGCHACANACPKRCITMQTDNEGFLYPTVDSLRCIDCGLCEKVCPVINQNEPHKPLHVYAAYNKNEEIRMHSSSGGIFTLLAEATINEGGVVFGAKFDKDWNVVHDYTETIDGIADFRGSKYVQSTIGNTYSEAKNFLQTGRKVLFSGTPCQIAGLKKYLRKEYDNLLTVDIICHGVPSPLVWRRYIDETADKLRAERAGGKNTVSLSLNEIPVIKGISFRDKTHGWKKFGFRISYAAFKAAENSVSESAMDICESHTTNAFMRAFLSDTILRPSCYNCPAKQGKGHSDITIADFWGINHLDPDFDDNKGCGAIFLNTEEGINAYPFEMAENKEKTFEEVIQYNSAYYRSSKPNPKRDTYFKVLEKKGVYKATQSCLHKPKYVKLFLKIVRLFK